MKKCVINLLIVAGIILAPTVGAAQEAGDKKAGDQKAKVSDDVVRIGVLTSFTGPYAALAGKGSVVAVKMAVEDFGGEVLGKPIEVVKADHQNKAAIGASKAREWFTVGGVDMITELNNSAVALAVNQVAADVEEVIMVNGSSDVELTGKACTKYTVHYSYNGYSLAQGTAKTIVKNGGKSWFFLTVNFAFGQDLQRVVADVVKKHGGKVVGTVYHKLGASDLSSGVLQAAGSGAEVIALATTGPDAVQAARTISEFGLADEHTIAGLLLWIQDVHSLGLELGQGLILTNSFYWDMNEQTRAFAKEFKERTGMMPNMGHAGDYSATLSYLKAVKAAGTDQSDAVMDKLKSLPIDDGLFEGYIRKDGQFVHEMYVWEVKSPEESKYPYDYLELVKTIPGEEAFKPLSEHDKCSFLD